MAGRKFAPAMDLSDSVQTNSLKHIKEETISSSFEEPQYTGISKDYKINMAWHNVENTTANGYIQDMLASTKGLTTIAPTWFHIADTQGNLNSIADADYVNYAHQPIWKCGLFSGIFMGESIRRMRLMRC